MITDRFEGKQHWATDERCAGCEISVQCRHCWAGISLLIMLPHFSFQLCFSPSSCCCFWCCLTCRCLLTCSLCRATLVWLVGSCVLQLLIDLSEYVNLSSATMPALAKTQWQPPKPLPVSTRASAAQLVWLTSKDLCSIPGLFTNGAGEPNLWHIFK